MVNNKKLKAAGMGLLLPLLLFVALVLWLEALLVPGRGTETAQAASIVGYNATTVLADGTTGYTDTQVTAGLFSRAHAHARIQVSLEVTGTTGITVTPQFTLDPVGCALATEWFSGTGFLATAAGSVGAEVDVDGTCFRLRYAPVATTTGLFTPTLWVSLGNKQ